MSNEITTSFKVLFSTIYAVNKMVTFYNISNVEIKFCAECLTEIGEIMVFGKNGKK